jgi:MFS transporter, YNFM family, putative membrane transport protein
VLGHPAAEPTDQYFQRGTAAYWRANLALFVAALVSFAILYCTQPLLPTFSQEFGLAPATASLSLSVATASLALALVVAGSLSEVWGRKAVIAASLAASSALMLLGAFSPDFAWLVVLRALQGLALAGAPAVAMAYLAEEVHPAAIGLAMGLLISGNTVGGLSGRVLTATLADAYSWRVALGLLGVFGLAATLAFLWLLPPSARFRPRPLAARQLAASLGQHLADPGLRWLYVSAALLMGGFVTLYNYLGYRLVAPPYELSQAMVGWLFTLYLVGTFSSAWMGRLADRLGRRRVLWVGEAIMLAGAALTLAAPLPVVVAGVGVFTFGFFGAHSIASGWVGRRARTARAQAASLYLLCYYGGSSLIGWLGGLVYGQGGWPAVVALIAGLVLVALIGAARLATIPPVDADQRELAAP